MLSSFFAPWLWRELYPFYGFEIIKLNFKDGLLGFTFSFVVLLFFLFMFIWHFAQEQLVLQTIILCFELDISDDIYYCLLVEREFRVY